MKARDIMTRKVVTVKKDCTVGKLITILKENSITGAPVVDNEGNLVGIVSVKDLIEAISVLIKTRLSAKEIKDLRGKFNWVEGFMTADVITADAESDILDVFELMVKEHIHRVPIMENGKMVGILSASDAYRTLLRFLEEHEGKS